MARHSLIPDKLIDEIMVLQANGKTGAEIQTWLHVNHQIKCSLSSVNRLVTNKKKERQAVAQEVFADAVAKSANQDINILGKMIVNLENEFQKAMAEGDRQGMKHMADSLHKFLSTRMDLSGINQPDSKQPEDETLQSLLDRIKTYDN